MSDDLIERLRRQSGSSHMCLRCDDGIKAEAAAVIERLAAALEAAERQLAEAREVLEFYSCDCQPGQCENGPLESNRDTVSCGYRARAALAGEKKE